MYLLSQNTSGLGQGNCADNDKAQLLRLINAFACVQTLAVGCRRPVFGPKENTLGKLPWAAQAQGELTDAARRQDVPPGAPGRAEAAGSRNHSAGKQGRD